jgi:dsRNA-specific ribonuclease
MITASQTAWLAVAETESTYVLAPELNADVVRTFFSAHCTLQQIDCIVPSSVELYRRIAVDPAAGVNAALGVKVLKLAASAYAYEMFPTYDTERLTTLVARMVAIQVWKPRLSKWGVATPLQWFALLHIASKAMGLTNIVGKILAPEFQIIVAGLEGLLDVVHVINRLVPGTVASKLSHTERIEVLRKDLAANRGVTIISRVTDQAGADAGVKVTVMVTRNAPNGKAESEIAESLTQSETVATVEDSTLFESTVLHEARRVVGHLSSAKRYRWLGSDTGRAPTVSSSSQQHDGKKAIQPAAAKRRPWESLNATDKRAVCGWIMRRLKTLLRFKDSYREQLQQEGLLVPSLESAGWLPAADVYRMIEDAFVEGQPSVLFPGSDLVHQLVECHDHFQRYQLGRCDIVGSPFEGTLCVRALSSHELSTPPGGVDAKVDKTEAGSHAEAFTTQILRSLARLPSAATYQACMAASSGTQIAWICVDRKLVGNLHKSGFRLYDSVAHATAFTFASLEKFAAYLQTPREERYDDKLKADSLAFMEFRLDAMMLDIDVHVYRLPTQLDGAPGHFALLPSGRYVRRDEHGVMRFLPLAYSTGRVCRIAAQSTSIHVESVVPPVDPNLTTNAKKHINAIIAAADQQTNVPLATAVAESGATFRASSLYASPETGSLHSVGIASLSLAAIETRVVRQPRPLDVAPVLSALDAFAKDTLRTKCVLSVPKKDEFGVSYFGRATAMTDIKQAILRLDLKYRAVKERHEDRDELIVTKTQNMDASGLDTLQREIGYQFRDSTHLQCAITPEHVNAAQNYERLEFIGDAVLDYVIVHDVAAIDPSNIPRVQAAPHDICQNAVLAWMSPFTTLHATLKEYGTFVEKVFADTVESIVGACYEDGAGLDRVRALLFTIFRPRCELLHALLDDPTYAFEPLPSAVTPKDEAAALRRRIEALLSAVSSTTDQPQRERQLLGGLLQVAGTDTRREALRLALRTCPYANFDTALAFEAAALESSPFPCTFGVVKVYTSSVSASGGGRVYGAKAVALSLHYPVNEGYGLRAGDHSAVSHQAMQTLHRIQDKTRATHFTTGFQYSYRLATPDAVKRRVMRMMESELEALTGRGRPPGVDADPLEHAEFFRALAELNRAPKIRRRQELDELMTNKAFPVASPLATAASQLNVCQLYVNELITPVTSLVFDIDGVSLLFCGLHRWVAEWAYARFPALSQIHDNENGGAIEASPLRLGVVLDCSGRSVVKKTWKFSYHLHFPSIKLTLADLSHEIDSLRQFVTSYAAQHVHAVTPLAVRRGMMVLVHRQQHDGGAATGSVVEAGRVLLTAAQLSHEFDNRFCSGSGTGKARNCFRDGLLTGTLAPVARSPLVLQNVAAFLHPVHCYNALASANTAYRAVTLVVVRLLLKRGEVVIRRLVSPFFKTFAPLQGCTADVFLHTTEAECTQLVAPSTCKPLVDALNCATALEASGGSSTSTSPATPGAPAARPSSKKQLKVTDFWESVMLPMVEQDLYSQFFWAKVIDRGLATSSKLRQYYSDKFDQKYGKEARPLLFAGELRYPDGLHCPERTWDHETLYDAATLRSPSWVDGTTGNTVFAWSTAVQQRYDAALNYMQPSALTLFTTAADGHSGDISYVALLASIAKANQPSEKVANNFSTPNCRLKRGDVSKELSKEQGGQVRRVHDTVLENLPHLDKLAPVIDTASWDTLLSNIFVVRPEVFGSLFRERKAASQAIVRYAAAQRFVLVSTDEDGTVGLASGKAVFLRSSAMTVRQAAVSSLYNGDGILEIALQRIFLHLRSPPLRLESIPGYVGADYWDLSVEGGKMHQIVAALERRRPSKAVATADGTAAALATSKKNTTSQSISVGVEEKVLPTARAAPTAAVRSVQLELRDTAAALKYLGWRVAPQYKVPNSPNITVMALDRQRFLADATVPDLSAAVLSEAALRSILEVTSAAGMGKPLWAVRSPALFDQVEAIAGQGNVFLYPSFPQVRPLTRDTLVQRNVLILLEVHKTDPVQVYKAVRNAKMFVVVQSALLATALATVLDARGCSE